MPIRASIHVGLGWRLQSFAGLLAKGNTGFSNPLPGWRAAETIHLFPSTSKGSAKALLDIVKSALFIDLQHFGPS